jgi:hypothetical protein
VTGHTALCREAVASVGSIAVVRVCGPLSAADLLPFGLVLLALLWPDLIQIEALGWSFTKRAREETERLEAQGADWLGVGLRVEEKGRDILGPGSRARRRAGRPSRETHSWRPLERLTNYARWASSWMSTLPLIAPDMGQFSLASSASF